MTKHGKKWWSLRKFLLLGGLSINSTLFLTMWMTQARQYIKLNKQKQRSYILTHIFQQKKFWSLKNEKTTFKRVPFWFAAMSFAGSIGWLFLRKQVMTHQAENCNKQTWIHVYPILRIKMLGSDTFISKRLWSVPCRFVLFTKE